MQSEQERLKESMSNQTEMDLNEMDDPTTQEELDKENEEKKIADEMNLKINAMLDELKGMGLDCLLAAHNSELNLSGAWGTSDSEVINLGLAGLVARKFQ